MIALKDGSDTMPAFAGSRLANKKEPSRDSLYLRSANGNPGVDAARKALDIDQSDELMTTSGIFLALASCILAVGPVPVVAEVDDRQPEWPHISPSELIGHTPPSVRAPCLFRRGAPEYPA